MAKIQKEIQTMHCWSPNKKRGSSTEHDFARNENATYIYRISLMKSSREGNSQNDGLDEHCQNESVKIKDQLF